MRKTRKFVMLTIGFVMLVPGAAAKAANDGERVSDRSGSTVEASRAIRLGAETFASYLSPSTKDPRLHFKQWRGDRVRRRCEAKGRVPGSRISFRVHAKLDTSRGAVDGDYLVWVTHVRVKPDA